MFDLKFLGRGAAFYPAFGNTNAFFEMGEDLYFLDFGEAAFERVTRLLDLKKYRNIYALVTHLHADHAGSLASLMSYSSMVLGLTVNVVHPNWSVLTLLSVMGIDPTFYRYLPTLPADCPVQMKAHEVAHAKDMRAYGLELSCADETIYYSGDAADVPAAVVEGYLSGRIARIYQDTSSHPSAGHCFYEKLEAYFPAEKRANVYCMHLDHDYEQMLRDLGFSVAQVLDEELFLMKEDTLLEKMAKIVFEAGALARRKALSSSVHEKGSNDFVTDADLAVSRFLEERLPKLIEGSSVLSEEDAEKCGVSGKLFIIDPIDGTTNLMYGMNMSVISCAYCEDGEPVLAAVYQPFTGELFTAEKGKGAYLNGKPIRVSSDKSVADALVGVEVGPATRECQERFFQAMHEVQKISRGLRLTGSAALDLCLTACGRLSGTVYHYLYPWDYAAGWLLVSEAGGRLSLVSGEKPAMQGISAPILATNGLIHEELAGMFKGV